MKSNHVLWTVFSVVDYDALEFDVTYDGASDTYSLMAHFHRNDIEDDLPNEDADDLSKDLTDLSFVAPEETVDDDDIDHDSMEILSTSFIARTCSGLRINEVPFPLDPDDSLLLPVTTERGRLLTGCSSCSSV